MSKRASFWLRFMAGSLKGSTRAIWKKRRRCWRSWGR